MLADLNPNLLCAGAEHTIVYWLPAFVFNNTIDNRWFHRSLNPTIL